MITNISRYRSAIIAAIMLSICISTIGCKTAQNAGAGRLNAHNEQCAELWLAYPSQPHPVWQELKREKVTISSSVKLPGNYRVFRVNADTLASLMTSGFSNKQFAMVMPIGPDCETFLMNKVEDQPANTQGLPPNSLHVHGYGVNNHNADLRLLWSGKDVRGQIVFNGATFPVVPVESSAGLVYLFFNKADLPGSAAPLPTENMKPAKQQVTYDR